MGIFSIKTSPLFLLITIIKSSSNTISSPYSSSSIGSIGFLTSGFLLKANLPLSLGFVNIPAFLIFIPITSFMARVGANMVHTTDKNKTQRMFGVFLYVIGTLFLIRFLDL